MKQILSIFLLATALVISGCASTTMGGATGSDRSQFLLISSNAVNAGAAQAYKKQLSSASTSGALNTDSGYTDRVKAIAKRLIAQVGIFRPDALSWQWEVNVISSDEINAYCMPGGKIAVYTGIISRLKLTDDELAAVVGHEMSHALREHSREQISQQMASQTLISLGSSLLGLGSIGSDIASSVSKYVLTLPFSRTMETEADIMGMELMARAGYDPTAAPAVWRKMVTLGGNASPEILSTHPSDSTRIANLEQHLPQVMPLYEKARASPKN
ncbi:MAG: M48 family metallopeptidase [Burkholderiaceae bacterium]|jgi:predicted Zn-dependent protease|nr:M48 family metallopeptidase [Burkholderiaceae bacterium]